MRELAAFIRMPYDRARTNSQLRSCDAAIKKTRPEAFPQSIAPEAMGREATQFEVDQASAAAKKKGSDLVVATPERRTLMQGPWRTHTAKAFTKSSCCLRYQCAICE
jgi:hypothetical protein